MDRGRRRRHALAETSEGVWLLDRHPAFPLRAPPDIAETLGRPGRPGRPARAAAPARPRRRPRLDRPGADGDPQASRARRSPASATIADGAASFAAEIADAVRKAIDPAGDVADDASPALREHPRSAPAPAQQAADDARGFLRGKDTAKYLQEQVVTDRHGRYVRGREVGAPPRHPGHRSTAARAPALSLFVEPLPAGVELNNDHRRARRPEAAEVRRILLA